MMTSKPLIHESINAEGRLRKSISSNLFNVNEIHESSTVLSNLISMLSLFVVCVCVCVCWQLFVWACFWVFCCHFCWLFPSFLLLFQQRVKHLRRVMINYRHFQSKLDSWIFSTGNWFSRMENLVDNGIVSVPKQKFNWKTIEMSWDIDVIPKSNDLIPFPLPRCFTIECQYNVIRCVLIQTFRWEFR